MQHDTLERGKPRQRAEDARQRYETLMAARRARVAAHDLEDAIAHAFAGRTLAEGVAEVWKAGYARGWRDRAELTR